MQNIDDIIRENERRKTVKHEYFNPLTGENSVGDRFAFRLSDFPIPIQYLPSTMRRNRLITTLSECGSIDAFLDKIGSSNKKADRDWVIKKFIRLRCRHDFPFWAFMFVKIKPKLGGDDIPFKLNYPQRTLLVPALERMRLSEVPIRIILVKARQWGGSTCIQMYMAWIQMLLKKSWNSLVVSNEMQSTAEVKGMFTKFISNYPLWMLHDDKDEYSNDEKKVVAFEGSQSIDYIPARNCKIKTGTAENPDSSRGGDSSMVHCTEIGVWKKTQGKSPEDIVQAACSGVLYRPLTVIAYESTAKGVGNYFHSEWIRAKRGESDKAPLFVPWYVIEVYELGIKNIRKFVDTLIAKKNDDEGIGKYLWWLWEQGATLESINWYAHERKGKSQFSMASEYPTNDTEAFANSGNLVFDSYLLNEMEKSCREPLAIGELTGDEPMGSKCLNGLRFIENCSGLLKIWKYPDTSIRVKGRYIVSVDIGGRWKGADYSVICVIDRYWMIFGDKMEVVAEWYGHIRHDRLAWISAQIAKYYCEATLVFESNTLETKDKDRDTDGDHLGYILDEIGNAYKNLYARDNSPENIRNGVPRKWGFHTDVSTKVAIIDTLTALIEDNGYIERDIGTINEYRTYEKRQDNSYAAITGCHDDKLMARGIGLLVSLKKIPFPKLIKETDKPVTPHKFIGKASTF